MRGKGHVRLARTIDLVVYVECKSSPASYCVIYKKYKGKNEMARYKGVIHQPNQTVQSELFRTIAEAEKWIDENNNNHEFKSVVQEVNEGGNLIDWYDYT